MFFSGYDIWAKRQCLASRYWGEIAPENRNIYRKSTKKHRAEEQTVQSKCKNPFHFLHRHSNLSKKRPTKCPCSRVKYDTRPIVHRDIRSFTFHLPNTSHQPRSEITSLLQDNRCILPPHSKIVSEHSQISLGDNMIEVKSAKQHIHRFHHF